MKNKKTKKTFSPPMAIGTVPVSSNGYPALIILLTYI